MSLVIGRISAAEVARVDETIVTALTDETDNTKTTEEEIIATEDIDNLLLYLLL